MQVSYESELRNFQPPYDVVVNEAACYDFLTQEGMPGEKFDMLQVKVARKEDKKYGNSPAYYDFDLNTLFLSTDWAWNSFKESYHPLIQNRLLTGVRNGIFFDGLRATLPAINPSKGVEGINIALSYVMAHELKHSTQENVGWKKLYMNAKEAVEWAGYFASIPLANCAYRTSVGLNQDWWVEPASYLTLFVALLGMPIARRTHYLFNPHELGAKLAEWKYRRGPQDRHLVNIIPINQ